MASPALEPPPEPPPTARRIVRCGTFEVDLDSRELRKAGALVRLRQQAFTVLALLVSEPGRVFTREDLRQRVWGDETFVDFDQGLNSCVKEIRAALADNAEAPVYVETLPKRGYRWIGPAELLAPLPAAPVRSPARREGRRLILEAVLGLAAVALAVWIARRPAPPDVRWRRVTFQRGWVDTARFVPGGGLVYAAAWGEGPLALYQASDASPDARRLPVADVRLQAVSPRGELAVTRSGGAGLLSRLPLAGGPAKDLLDHVISADFVGESAEMAVVHLVPGEGARVEYPVGHTLALANAPEVRVSPDGQRVAFVDYPVNGDDRGAVMVAERGGRRRTLGPYWPGIEGLAWSPRGDEVWFTATADGSYALRAVSLTGRVRTLLPAAGRMRLRDVAPDGRVLIERATTRIEATVVDASGSHDLSWFDASVVADLSADGRVALVCEMGEAGGPEYAAYLRPTDGSPPLRVGNGRATGLSADGSWIAAVPTAEPDHVDLVPAGAGAARTFRADGIVRYDWADFAADGTRMLFVGQRPAEHMRVWISGADGHEPRPLTPERLVVTRNTISPDGRWLVAGCPPLTSCLYPLDGGERQAIPGILGSSALFWSADSRTLFVGQPDPAGLRIERLDVATGRRTPWRVVGPSDRVGFVRVSARMGTVDGSAVAFSAVRNLSELYVVTGVR